MKDARQFLLISLIVHLLVFIVLAYVVLPPVDRFKGFLGGISVDIVKLRPVVIDKDTRLPEDHTEQGEKKVSEVPRNPKLPEPVDFPLIVEKPFSDRITVDAGERKATLRIMLEKKQMASVQQHASKPIPRPAGDEDTVTAPGFYQDGGDLAGTGGETGFGGLRPEPVGGGAGTKGQSMVYLYPYAPLPQPKKANEFADILPALARGILERTTRSRMDVVFVVDTTGSMQDNVRGVKDYIHRFLEPIEEKGLDVALGLVEFTDIEVREAKVVGLTRDPKKFRKWLDKTRFYGGEDIPESGYEALLAALEEIDFRDGAQKFIILISDAPQHDFDYDGKSRYSLDRIIARLNDEGVQVDVVGANYRPMKQLAWGTGGQWKHIPGGDPAVDVPDLTSTMIRSRLERSLPPVLVEDRVTIEFKDSVPDWVDLSYKMLDPRGLKCLGTLTYRKEIEQKTEKKVEFFTTLDLRQFKDQPGTYTLIYRIRDSIGNRDVLRRTLELRGTGS